MNISWGLVMSGMLLRAFACVIAVVTLMLVFNDYLIFWLHWPGVIEFIEHKQWFGLGPLSSPLEGYEVTLGWLQLVSYAGPIVLVSGYVLLTPKKSLRADADSLSAMAAYIVRAAFWSVLLIGIADIIISLLRIEGLFETAVELELTQGLDKSRFRGVYIHYPLILVSLVIAYFERSLSFLRLVLVIVIAELQIVISSFVFSYEHAFTGDLVRFWYAALFLITTAYILVDDNHPRDDGSYPHFSDYRKAWINVICSAALGVPLCWIILSTGLWEKGSSIDGLLLRFKIPQNGFGMYVKYLLASFLVVLAVSMAIRFMSDFLNNAATLRNEPRDSDETAPAAGSRIG